MPGNRRGKDNRFYFSKAQLVLLGGAFTLASVIIFFLGIFVGREIEERRMIRPAESVVKIPVKPVAQGGGSAPATQAKEELTFYDTLTKSPDAQPRVDQKLKEAKAPEKVAKAEMKENKTKSKEEPPPALSKTVEKDVEKPVQLAEAPQKAQSSETSEQNETGRTWTVQVNAFPDDRSAKIWVDRLKNKGYNAYVKQARNKGKTWYRVRVGRYGSRSEAEKVVETLKTKENFTKAFATGR